MEILLDSFPHCLLSTGRLYVTFQEENKGIQDEEGQNQHLRSSPGCSPPVGWHWVAPSAEAPEGIWDCLN